MVIKVIFEIAISLVIVYGIFHEEQLVELENVIWWAIKNPGKVINNIKVYVED